MKLTRITRTAVVALVVLAALLPAGLAGAGCSGEPSSPSQTSVAQPTTSEAQAAGTAAEPTTTAAGSAAYVTVDVQEAFEQLKADPEAQIVDVREPTEWATTGVPVGAILIPLGELEQRAPGELAKDKPVYVICNSGNRSRTGSETLLALGFTEVYNVAGGIQAWLKAGLPVEAYEG
jgi:rhodanese-related sulfurtransferase